MKCKYADCVEVCPVDCFYEGERLQIQTNVLTAWPMKIRKMCCPETSVTTNLGCVTSQINEYLTHTAMKAWNHSVAVYMWICVVRSGCLYKYNKIYIVLPVLTINRVTDFHQIMPTCFTFIVVWLISRGLLLDLSVIFTHLSNPLRYFDEIRLTTICVCTHFFSRTGFKSPAIVLLQVRAA
jgi:NAD-dependent dihydropyrimidine dehydrogenase PreA subunit